MARLSRIGWAAALGLLCALQMLALCRAPSAWYPAAVKVTLPAGASMVLGRDTLAAPRAALAHLRVERSAHGEWRAAALSQTAPIAVRRNGVDERSGTVVLQDGQRFALGAARFTVRDARDGVVLTDGRDQWRYDGGTVYRNGAAQPPCPATPVATHLTTLWNRATPAALNVRRALAFGGNLHCGTRIGIPHVDPSAATLARTKDGFVLTASAGAASPLVLVPDIAAGLDGTMPARTVLSLAGAEALYVGQTRFDLYTTGNVLTLVPSRHVALYTDTHSPLPSNVVWDWRERTHWTVPRGLALAIGAALATLVLIATAIAAQRGRWPYLRATARTHQIMVPASALLAVTGLTALLLQRSGTPSGAGVSMLLGWCALWCVLLLFGRRSLAVAAATILLAAGMLAQLELGLGGADVAWLRHFQKTCALLAIGMGTGTFIALRLRAGAPRIPQVTLEWLLAVLALTALAALALQVLFGDETGVFDLQPVEFAKLALTALTAHCIAVGLGWKPQSGPRSARADNWRWLRMTGPVLVFIALLAFALVQVDDYSPLMLLLVWSTSIVFAWSIAARRWLVALPVVLAAAGAVAVVVLMREAGPAALSGMSFYGDRFQVWLDPATHPHTGEQVLLGARAIAEGSWLGADNFLGLRTLGLPAGETMHIPAVQDDFAPAFFLNRHGLAGALVLWTLQALFLAGLLHSAMRAWAVAQGARDFHGAWLARFRCFALCGGAAFVLGHFLLSWGTNLAIFPVMGQPMSFLSAGGSHLLFFVCPLLVLGAISAQSSEEISSCRSMSNTRC